MEARGRTRGLVAECLCGIAPHFAIRRNPESDGVDCRPAATLTASWARLRPLILQRRVASFRRRMGKGDRVEAADPESTLAAAEDAAQQLEYEHVLHAAVRALK